MITTSFKNSFIYEGSVIHNRRLPKPHKFNYSLYMLYLDLDELEGLNKVSKLFSINKPNLLSFYEKDFHNPKSSSSLKQKVIDTIFQKSGIIVDGPVRVLTQIRSLGFVFNPVSFYFAFDKNEKLVAIMSEIQNTPWNERYCYINKFDHEKDIGTFEFDKNFHISPFMSLEQRYKWQISKPNSKIFIKMENFEKEHLTFLASLNLKKMELNSKNLFKMIGKHPFITYKVIAGIYIQAAKLYLKKIPFYSHPNPKKQISSPLHIKAKGKK